MQVKGLRGIIDKKKGKRVVEKSKGDVINKKNVPVVANNVIQVLDYVGRNVAQENFKNRLGIQIEDNDSIQVEEVCKSRFVGVMHVIMKGIR